MKRIIRKRLRNDTAPTDNERSFYRFILCAFLLLGCIGRILRLDLSAFLLPDLASIWVSQQRMPSFSSTTTMKTIFDLDLVPSMYLEQLPLQHWQLGPIGNMNDAMQCDPPPVFSVNETLFPAQMCCLGSHSSAPIGSYNEDSVCVSKRTQKQYLDVEELAGRFLAHHPPRPSSREEEVMTCDICQILTHLWNQHDNASIAFLGDSVIRQVVGVFMCETLQRGFEISDIETQTNDIRYTGSRDWRQGIRETYNFTVRPPRRSEDNGDDDQRPQTTIHHYSSYRPWVHNFEIARIAADHDIVVFDHGVHYAARQPKVLINDMNGYLSIFKNATNSTTDRLKLVIWRESTAQHFTHSPTGDFISAFKANKTCVAHQPLPKNPKIAPNFRAQLMQTAAIQSGFQYQSISDSAFWDRPHDPLDLVVLPFWNFSAQLHFMHPANDCTHFCNSPGVWAPVYRGLRLAMDRLYQS